jgi:hypothetical protein
MYYNTNKEVGETLNKSIIKSKTQEENLLVMFKDNIKLSASQAWIIYGKERLVPITSIRRAITNLYNREELIKTNETTAGIYGKSEHIYQYNKQ